MKKRPYKLGKRAQSRDATRERIVTALMQLHEDVGPRNTTISAIAERAGVQRLTVYRHFADETELFQACTSRWLELNPPPDPDTWSGIADPFDRCRTALRSLYAYYRATERMWTVSFRDESEVPALHGPMKAFREYVERIACDLLAALHAPEATRPAVAATVRHSVEFGTWASLGAHGLDDTAAAELAAAWVRTAVYPELEQQRHGAGAPVSRVTVVLHGAAGEPVLEGDAPMRPIASGADAPIARTGRG